MIHLLSAGLALSVLSASPATPVALTLHDSGGDRGETYLRFVLHSRKAGLISTDVEGHVKDFEVSFEWAEDTARQARARFAARDMRTDNGSRDEKMWSYCLDADHNPRVEIELDTDVPVGRQVQVSGRMHVRGAWHPLKLTAFLRREHDRLVLDASSTVKLSELGIPDPSIWIAKVDDSVELALQVVTKVPET